MLQNGLERKHKLILFLSMDSRWYKSYFIHLLIELTNKRKKKVPKREKVSVTDAIDRKIVRCGMLSKPILRNRLYCLYTFDIIAKRNYRILSWRLPFNPFPKKPWFLRFCSTSLLETLWEKEKLLVTSNFSFSHSVFYPVFSGELSAIFIKFEIVV